MASDREIHVAAQEAARLAVAALHTENKHEEGRQSALLDQLSAEVRQLSSDIRPLITQQATQNVLLQAHEGHIRKLMEAHERELTEPSASTDRIKAIARVTIAEQQAESRKPWRDMMPAIITGIVGSVVSGLLLIWLSGDKNQKAPDPAVVTPAATSTVSPKPPSIGP